MKKLFFIFLLLLFYVEGRSIVYSGGHYWNFDDLTGWIANDTTQFANTDGMVKIWTTRRSTGGRTISTSLNTFAMGQYRWRIYVAQPGIGDGTSIGAYIYNDDSHQIGFDVGYGSTSARSRCGAKSDEIVVMMTTQGGPYSQLIIPIKAGWHDFELNLSLGTNNNYLVKWFIDGIQRYNVQQSFGTIHSFKILCSVGNYGWMGTLPITQENYGLFDHVEYTPLPDGSSYWNFDGFVEWNDASQPSTIIPNANIQITDGILKISTGAGTSDRKKIATIQDNFSTGRYRWRIYVAQPDVGGNASVGAFLYNDDWHEIDFEVGYGKTTDRVAYGVQNDEILAWMTTQGNPFSSSAFPIKAGWHDFEIDISLGTNNNYLVKWFIDGVQRKSIQQIFGASYKFRIFCSVENLSFMGDHLPTQDNYGLFDYVEYTKTLAVIPPTVTTNAVTALSHNSVTLNGNVVQSNQVIIERGFEWKLGGASTWIKAPISGTYNAITYNLIGLTANTTYDIRVFATTVTGTTYGTTINFITLSGYYWNFDNLTGWLTDDTTQFANTDGMVKIWTTTGSTNRRTISTSLNTFAMGRYRWRIYIAQPGIGDGTSIGAYIYNDDSHQIGFDVGYGSTSARSRCGAKSDEIVVMMTTQGNPYSQLIIPIKTGWHDLELDLSLGTNNDYLVKWFIDSIQRYNVQQSFGTIYPFKILCSVGNYGWMGTLPTTQENYGLFDHVEYTPLPDSSSYWNFDGFVEWNDYSQPSTIILNSVKITSISSPIPPNTGKLIPNIVIYPNPTKNDLNIKIGEVYSTAILTISSSWGQVLHQEKIEPSNNILLNIDMSAFAKGNYYINICSDKINHAQSIIKY